MRLSLLGRPDEPGPLLRVMVPAQKRQAMNAAVRIGDYASLEGVVGEALFLWHRKRQCELEELAALQSEIARLLARQRPDPAKVQALRERDRNLLGRGKEGRHGPHS
ncbi:MAG: hypothetical protein HY765_00195 [Rhodomicrobium sp.]|nr:hypothetical protein [Rhodomicrobium sp.]